MNQNNNFGTKEALKYVLKIIRLNIRVAWVLGVFINIYLFSMAYLKTEYRINVFLFSEALLIIAWLAFSILGGMVNGACIYRICQKAPQIFLKERSALDNIEKRNPFKNISAMIEFYRACFSLYRVKEFVIYLCIATFIVVVLSYLKQLRFGFVILTGWLIGIDLFWNMLKKGEVEAQISEG